MRELVKVILLHVLGAFGMPLHWFSDGGEANLATAGEMGGPTIRKLLSVQTEIRMLLRTLCEFQIALKRALAPEELGKEGADAEFQIVLPEIVSKDTAREATMLTQVISAVSIAVEEEFFSRKDGALIVQALTAGITDHEFGDETRDLTDRLGEPELGAEPMPGVEPGDLGGAPADDAAAEFNELTLAIQRLASIGDEALIDALRNELFKRLGMKKPDTLDKEDIAGTGGGNGGPPAFVKNQGKPLPPALAKRAKALQKAEPEEEEAE
jgi:hypothetical protein